MTAPSLHSSADLASLSPELRDDLRGYADLGGFTLTAATHAWYAAAETIGGPEEARAASTVLTELRVRDLPAVARAAGRIGEGTDFDAPGTVEETERIVALLLRVRSTLRTLSPEAYGLSDDELHELIAATANGAWRRERGLKLSWLRRRAPGKRARTLASGRARRDALHAALTATSADRAEWAALQVPGRPALPADADFLDEGARASQAAIEGLGELGRLLRSESDLKTLPFDELTELLERLSADEGTLFRLPTLRTARDRLTEAGLTDVVAELTERRTDSAALTALLGDTATAGTAPVPAPRVPADADDTAAPEEAPEVADEREELVAPAGVSEPEAVTEPEADAVTLAEVEPEVVVPTAEVDSVAESEVEAVVLTEAEPVVEPEVVVPTAEVDSAAESEVEVEEGSPSEPESVTSVEPEVVVAAEPEPELEAVAEPEVVVPAVEAEPVVEKTSVSQPESVTSVETEATANVSEPETEVEPEPEHEVVVAAAAVEPAVEAEPEAGEASLSEPESDTVSAVSEPESVTSVEPEVMAPAAAEVAVEPEPEPEAVTQPEPVADAQPDAGTSEPEQPVAEAPAPEEADGQVRPARPAIEAGKAVTAYAPEELAALVRWIDTDGVERTDDELLRAAMKELGFARLGPRIKEALGAAVAAARA
ncbi:hypothetical protein ACIP9H_30440 [Streptomyces sp. NPDC088732]|uniref:hypothetical protein n=1 Tax=Streptomyces sp. NPDC088732 TaxID=3365879 RepID=UPI0037F3B1A1